MAIGRTFCESLQKALRSLEQGRAGLNADPAEVVLDELDDEQLLERVAVATPDRIFELEAALRRGVPADDGGGTHRHRSVVRPADRADHRRTRERIAGRRHARPGRLPAGQAAGLLRRAAGLPAPHRRGRGPAGAARPRRAGHVQDGRHLRGGVRGLHARTTTPPTRRRTRSVPRGGTGSSSSARAPTASGRGSSSTTAASTPPCPCATPATRPS